MSGAEPRHVFFHDKSLSFTEGYALLMGAAPRLEDIKVETDSSDSVSAFNKRLAKILRKDRLQDVIPTLFSDANKRMEAWGNDGRLDPFDKINNLVFQMTVRMASCSELASNDDDVQHMHELYLKLQRSATPIGLLLPWLPTQFVLLVIFVGVLNTGMMACWTILYLGAHPEWKTRAVAEIQRLVETHTDTTSTLPLHQRLSTIPISAWEDEMPVLELITRETLRLVNNGIMLRRNILADIEVSGKIIPRGAFMAYQVGDVHLNAQYYPNPLKWNLARFAGGSAQNEAPYIGWGAGRHPCTGIKVAKFEVKMILALVLTRDEYMLVDSAGAPTMQVPEPTVCDT
ncbi:hypothetical protein HWV62_13569 [Athelia sp. TMB]|nr:hypothetical protein HWV62_13569 [Athelia sp. TMB]